MGMMLNNMGRLRPGIVPQPQQQPAPSVDPAAAEGVMGSPVQRPQQPQQGLGQQSSGFGQQGSFQQGSPWGSFGSQQPAQSNQFFGGPSPRGPMQLPQQNQMAGIAPSQPQQFQGGVQPQARNQMMGQRPPQRFQTY